VNKVKPESFAIFALVQEARMFKTRHKKPFKRN
jgi:hypothetical protein